MASEEITQLLVRYRGGESAAMDDLFPLVYRQLRAMAGKQVGPGRIDATLNGTALVHEAYMKLVDRTRAEWHDSKHFFSVAAMAMRQILVDHARRKLAQKRGGDLHITELKEEQVGVEERALEIVAVDEAMTKLAELNERLGRVVELRFFGGLSVVETARVLEIDPATVKRDWRKACAFLKRELRTAPEEEDEVSGDPGS